MPGAMRHDHRQAPELRGGQAGGDAQCRASPAQGPEQPGQELAPADATTRTADEALHVAAASTALICAHDQINTLFHLHRGHVTASQSRAARARAFEMWAEISGI